MLYEGLPTSRPVMPSASLDSSVPFVPPVAAPGSLLAAGGARLPSLVGLTRQALKERLLAIGVPDREARMRTSQIWHWIYLRGIRSFDEMTNVSKALRSALAGSYSVERPEVTAEQVSVDGTRKWVIRMPST